MPTQNKLYELLSGCSPKLALMKNLIISSSLNSIKPELVASGERCRGYLLFMATEISESPTMAMRI